MKILLRNTFAIVVAFGLVLTVVSTPSCKEDKTNFGNVYVFDSAGNPFNAINVTVSHTDNVNSTNNNEVDRIEGITDGNGYVQFEFELPAVYDVVAIHPTDTVLGGSAKTAEGVLILNEPGTTDTEELKFK